MDCIDFIDDYQTTFDPARKVVDLNQVADSFQLVTVDHSIFEKKEEKTENDSSKEEFEMGRNYFEGINGYMRDTVLGIEYLKKSAKSGYVDSVIYYCRVLIEGICQIRIGQNHESKVVEETLNDNANHNNDESEDECDHNKSGSNKNNGNKVVENSEDDINNNDNSAGQSINCANDDINNGNDKSEDDENKLNQPNENGTNPANTNSSIAKIVEEDENENEEEEEEEDESGSEDEIEEGNEKEEEEIIEKIRENDVSYVAELKRLLPEHPPIEGRSRAVLICTGSFCPMHKGHLKLLDTAAKFLSNVHQIDSVLILSPSIDGFVRYRFKDEMIGYEDRYEMLKLGGNEHNMSITDDEGLFIIPDSWEGTRKRFYDYPEVLKHFSL